MMHITLCSLSTYWYLASLPLLHRKSPSYAHQWSSFCQILYKILCSNLFDLPENLTEVNILLYILPSLGFHKSWFLLSHCAQPVFLSSLSVDIISIVGHIFFTLVSFHLSMHCILYLNQCPKFMSTWWVSDFLFYILVPIYLSLSTCLLNISTWVPSKFQKQHATKRTFDFSFFHTPFLNAPFLYFNYCHSHPLHNPHNLPRSKFCKSFLFLFLFLLLLASKEEGASWASLVGYFSSPLSLPYSKFLSFLS